MDASRCADKLWQFFCACAVVFPLEILEQMIMTSLYDVMRFSHVIEGGNYKREHDQALAAAAAITVIWVFGQVFGSLLSHRPSTLAVLVPLE